jgi:hypothetical protein
VRAEIEKTRASPAPTMHILKEKLSIAGLIERAEEAAESKCKKSPGLKEADSSPVEHTTGDSVGRRLRFASIAGLGELGGAA